MKKILLVSCMFLMAACSSTKNAHKLNCEKLHSDSSAKLIELQKVFAAYQDISYDVAVRLTPALKEEVEQLDVRIRKQKQRCWQSEHRLIDSEIALLKEELVKTYTVEPAPRKQRATASVAAPVAETPKRAQPVMVPTSAEFFPPTIIVPQPTPTPPPAAEAPAADEQLDKID